MERSVTVNGWFPTLLQGSVVAVQIVGVKKNELVPATK
jgi:hypothetical protein